MTRSSVLLGGIMVLALSACGSDPEPPQYGANPALPEPQRGLLPSMVVSTPAQWGNDRPSVPEGYTIQAITSDLKIPRQTLVLPNGDILVAATNGAAVLTRLAVTQPSCVRTEEPNDDHVRTSAPDRRCRPDGVGVGRSRIGGRANGSGNWRERSRTTGAVDQGVGARPPVAPA